MGTLKVGFVGAGFISRFQLEALRYVRGVDLVGVVSPNRGEEFARLARDSGMTECVAYDSVREMCNHIDIPAIFSPNHTRTEIAEEIVDAVRDGAALRGVICEKPLGRTVQEAQRLVDLIAETALPTSYFENQLFMPPMQKQMEQLAPQQKAMGPMTLARAAEEHAGPHEPWFWDPTRQGGGVLSDMGCHSIAVCWYILTPHGKTMSVMEPISVNADVALLKWGQTRWRDQLKSRMGVDYHRTPAEDFATGLITFRNRESGQVVKGQFTVSWMYEKQGLRLFMDGVGPGYAFEMNTLQSPLSIFIGDEAAESVANSETALEKATASRGLLAVQPNEADLYGYVGEWEDLRDAFATDRPCLADWNFGLEITRLCQAAYLSAERGTVVDLTDSAVQEELKSYRSLIAQGRGSEVLLHRQGVRSKGGV